MRLLFLTFLVICFVQANQIFAQNCSNEDFEDGNRSGWKGFTGFINTAGKVTVDHPGFEDHRHMITAGNGKDPVAEGCGVDIPIVEEGGLFSLRLGNNQVGGEAERITKTFTVQPGQEFFLYKYAVVLEDPQHHPFEQPRFEVRVFDKDGNLAPCGEFKVRAGPNAKNEGFIECNSKINNSWGYSYTRKYWIKNWTVSGADLSAFVGQEVTIEFLTTDCSRKGHAGYAYVEASCKSMDIMVDGFCPGSSTATLSVTEGWKTYEWFNGGTKNSTTVTNLQVGDTVSVKVTSFAGCSTTITKVIDSVPPVTIDPIADQNVCKGEKAVLQASGQNIGYFLWSPLAEKAQQVVVRPNDTTDYFVEAYDLNGCPTGLKDTVRVHVRGFQLTTSSKDLTCSGFNDGQASVNVSGGIAPYTFAWSNGDSVASISDLSPGDYEVTVADSMGLGCEQSTKITINQPANINLVTGADTSRCNLNDGKAWVKVSGGIGQYTYHWPYNNTTDDTLINVPAGKYKVVVIDQNGTGCKVQTEVTVPEPRITTFIEGLDARCKINDGEANVIVQGGAGPFQYQWSHGENTEKVTDLRAGKYYIQVTDKNGCSTRDSVNILPPPPLLSGNISKNDALCALDDGQAIVHIHGGLSPYQIQWSNGVQTDLNDSLTAGIYEVTVIDGNNCKIEREVTINPPPPLLKASVETRDALCAINDGWAMAHPLDGTPPYQYQWLQHNASTQKIDSLEAGYYEVVVTDHNGCQATAGGSIAPPPPIMEATVETEGESYDLSNGKAEVELTGGVGPYHYLWEPVNRSGPEQLNLKAGTYHLYITDFNKCQILLEVIVEEIPPIEIPNAFTPNFDGHNEEWQLKNIGLYPQNRVIIYNRWGKQLFESAGYLSPWSGDFNGVFVPSDTYYYSIDLGIGIDPFVGFVDVIR